MPASVTLRRDYSAEELRRLAKSAQTISQGRRLLSLAAVMDGMSRADAARIGAWIGKRCATGFTGLMKRPRRAFGQLVERAGAASVAAQQAELAGSSKLAPTERSTASCAAALRSQARHQGALRRRLSRTPCRNAVEAARFSHISARPRHPGRTPRSSRLIKKTSRRR